MKKNITNQIGGEGGGRAEDLLMAFISFCRDTSSLHISSDTPLLEIIRSK